MLIRSCLLALVGASAWLSGCASLDDLEHRTRQARSEMTQTLASPSNAFQQPGLVRHERPLIGLTEVPVAPKPLPEQFDKDVSFASFGSQGLPEILDALSRMTGISIEAREVFATQPYSAAQQPPVGQQTPLSQQTLVYRYSGKLRWLLDDLAARLNASWRFDHDARQIIFYRYESGIFNVMLPLGKKGVNSSISIGGSAGGSSGGSTGGAGGGSVSIQSDMTIDPWASLMDGVRVFLGPSAGGATTSPTAATAGASAMTVTGSEGYAVGNRDLAQLIVVARPQVMQRIARFIEQTNRRFARNVLIDVRVIELQANKNDAFGMSISALLDKALSSSGLSHLNMQIIGAPTPVPGQASQFILSAQHNTSQKQVTVDAIVQALSTVSHISVRNQGQVVAINGQPAPFQQANQISYLASIQTSQVPNVGLQTSVQPATVTVGFTANFIPTIMADNRIMLQYQLQSSSLLGLRTVGPQNSQIQVPEIYTQSLQQQAYLRDGDVIMLFGFEHDRSQLSDTNGLWAQGRAGQSNHIMTAVIIQVRAAKEVI